MSAPSANFQGPYSGVTWTSWIAPPVFRHPEDTDERQQLTMHIMIQGIASGVPDHKSNCSFVAASGRKVLAKRDYTRGLLGNACEPTDDLVGNR